MNLDELMHPVYTKEGVRGEFFERPLREPAEMHITWASEQPTPTRSYRINTTITADAVSFREATDRLSEELRRLSRDDDDNPYDFFYDEVQEDE